MSKIVNIQRIIVLLLFNSLALFSDKWEIEYLSEVTLNQKKALIERVRGFDVDDEERFIIPDENSGNIKIYSSNGELIKIIGRKGEGPNEFSDPAFVDYENGKFTVIDWGLRRIFTFNVTKDWNLKLISKFVCPALAYDLKIYNDTLLIAGWIMRKDMEEFELYRTDFNGRIKNYLFPEKYKYDGDKNGYAIDLFTKIDYNAKHIYFIWKGSLKVYLIDPEEGYLGKNFGKIPWFYKRPKSKPLLKAYNERDKEGYFKAARKFTLVDGIFANDNFVGLIISEYNFGKQVYEYWVQLYDLEGNILINGIKLKEVEEYDDYDHCYAFVKNKSLLYILGKKISSDGENVEFKIFKYKIKFRK